MPKKFFGKMKKQEIEPTIPEPTNTSYSVSLSETDQLEILSLFLTPADPVTRLGEHAKAVWRDKLGAPFQSLVEALFENGLLREADTAEKLFAAYRLTELRQIALANKLKVSGRKTEVAERIASNKPNCISAKVQSSRVLICSDYAKECVDEFKGAKKNRLVDFQRQTVQLLRAGRYTEACEIVRSYEHSQFLQRGMGVDWSKPSANTLHLVMQAFEAKPAFHKNRFGGVQVPVRIFAAMFILWGTERFGIITAEIASDNNLDDLTLQARMLVFFCANHASNEQASSLGLELEIEIIAAEDENTTCAACLKDSGKRYAIGFVPEIPHAFCKCEIGCRCSATPHFVSFDV